VSDYSRLRRQQLLREAEGYLELMVGISDLATLNQALRDRLGEKALLALSRLEPASGQRAQACYLKGQIFRSMERYAEAVEPLKQSLEFDHENIHVWLALGWCYKRIHRLDQAIQSLEEALEIDPAEAIVHYNLACYWSLARNVKLAVMYLAQAFELDPNYRDRVPVESDFDPVRNDPHFLALTSVIV